MSIVQHAEMKSVFTFQPKKRLVSTTVKSAKPAAMFWSFLLRTKNWQLCCLSVTVHFVLQERRVATTKKKNNLHFKEISPPITTKHIRTWTRRGPIESKNGINLFVSYWLLICATYSNFKSFFSISIYRQPVKFNQITQNHHDLLSFQWRNRVDCRVWSRLCFFCSKWSRSNYTNQLTRNTPSRLAIAVVSKTRLFKQSFSVSSNSSQPRGNNGDERRNTLQCGSARLGH